MGGGTGGNKHATLRVPEGGRHMTARNDAHRETQQHRDGMEMMEEMRREHAWRGHLLLGSDTGSDCALLSVTLLVDLV